MSVEREGRADEEQLLEGSAAWARGSAPRGLGRTGVATVSLCVT